MKILTIQYVNYWNDPFNDRWLFHFIKENFKEKYQVIEVQNKKDCDILIASVMGPLNKISYYKAKLKLFFTGENLNRYSQYNNINNLDCFYFVHSYYYECEKEENILSIVIPNN